MSSTRAALARNSKKANVKLDPPVPGRSGSIPSIQGSRGLNTGPSQNRQQHVALRQNGSNNQMQSYNPSVPPQIKHSQAAPPSATPLTLQQLMTQITKRLHNVELFVQVIGDNTTEAENAGMNDDLAQNILSRLEVLEDAESKHEPNSELITNSTTTDSDIAIIKQQIDALKQFVNKSLKSIVAKSDITMLKNEIATLKKKLHTTEQISIENNAQLMILNMKINTNEADDEDEDDNNIDIDESINYLQTTPITSPSYIVEDEPDENDD